MTGAALQLASPVDGIRLTLHVLAAAVWVGGQLTMVGLVGPSRALGEAAPRTLARAFNKLAWPAYAVLFVTGMWNLAALHSSSMSSGSGMAVSASTGWNVVFGIKMTMFLIAGIAAFLHTRATSKAQLAIWGSVSGTASLAALCLGVFIAG